MESTFQDKQTHPDNDEQRRVDNAIRAEKGEPQVGGAAGRQQVASKDPAGEKGKETKVEAVLDVDDLFSALTRPRQHHWWTWIPGQQARPRSSRMSMLPPPFSLVRGPYKRKDVPLSTSKEGLSYIDTIHWNKCH